MSWEVLVGGFLLELSIISPFLEFLSIPLTQTPRAQNQRAGPSAAAQGGRGVDSGLRLPPPPGFSL